MYIADQNSIPMNFINQSVGIYLWDSPFSQSLYQGMTDQVLWWWSNLLRFQSTSFNAILSIKCEKRRKIFLCINLTVTFPQKKKRPFFFQLFICFLWMPSKLHLHSEKKTCFRAKIISNQEMNLGTHIFFILKKMCIEKKLRLAIRQKINKNAGISNSTTKKNAYNQLVILCLAYFSCRTPKHEVLHFCGKII